MSACRQSRIENKTCTMVPFPSNIEPFFVFSPQTKGHFRCSDQARSHFHCLHDLIQPLTRLRRSSRLPVSFNPLHLKHRSSCSIVYCSGSLSRIEPRTPSISLKTEENEANFMPHFPCDSYRLDFVCLSHLGVYNFMTSLVQSASDFFICVWRRKFD